MNSSFSGLFFYTGITFFDRYLLLFFIIYEFSFKFLLFFIALAFLYKS